MKKIIFYLLFSASIIISGITLAQETPEILSEIAAGQVIQNPEDARRIAEVAYLISPGWDNINGEMRASLRTALGVRTDQEAQQALPRHPSQINTHQELREATRQTLLDHQALLNNAQIDINYN